MGKVDLQPAYVLHTRPYRETSLLVDFITRDFGRVSAVARGIKNSKSGRHHLLQPFGALLISWRGQSELKSLTGVEEQYVRLMLHGDALFSGIYVNELLMHLLKTEEHSDRFFGHYERLVRQLATQRQIEPALRAFEKQLLEQLGYGIPFPQCNAALEHEFYYYAEDGHFTALPRAPDQTGALRCFRADELAAIAANQFEQPQALRAAKRLMRLAFTPLLGGRTLRSRELFNQQRMKDSFDER